jgi:phosphopantothenoylcysteine synthetase/decarboxylase
MFASRDGSWEMDHISLADRAGLLLVAPATAQAIAKMACGLADDLVAATALATTAPKLVAPAMNTRMYQHPATQKNIEILKGWGYRFVGPDEGRMACGTEGPGHLASIPSILAAVKALLP